MASSPGGSSQEGDYAQGLFLNVGTGVLLFAVLHLIQQNVLEKIRDVEETASSVEMLGKEVEAVRQEIQMTQARPGDLGQWT